MAHNYYTQDFPERKSYFDKQFLTNARKEANNLGISKESFLKNIKDFDSFKRILRQSWENDSSLLEYYNGMNDIELLEFFERPVIQKILNLEIKDVVEEIPLRIEQVKNRNRDFFVGWRNGKRTVGYKDSVTIRLKKIEVYRDSKGRFISIRGH